MRLRLLESGRTERGGMIRLCHKMRLQGKAQETEHSIIMSVTNDDHFPY